MIWETNGPNKQKNYTIHHLKRPPGGEKAKHLMSGYEGRSNTARRDATPAPKLCPVTIRSASPCMDKWLNDRFIHQLMKLSGRRINWTCILTPYPISPHLLHPITSTIFFMSLQNLSQQQQNNKTKQNKNNNNKKSQQ